LIPRDPDRGDRIERISYFGSLENLSAEFRTSSFINALKDIGVEFQICLNPKKWSDYSQIDLMLAVRNAHPWWLRTKPSSKMTMAWQGHCVPLLGFEPAFRAVGRPNWNYFEVQTPQDVLGVVAKLKANPSLYQQCREAGMEHNEQYGFDAIRQQWIDLLTGPVAEEFGRWQQEMSSRPWACFTHRLFQFIHQRLDFFWFYLWVEPTYLLPKQMKQKFHSLANFTSSISK
jgi:hypothetical protein